MGLNIQRAGNVAQVADGQAVRPRFVFMQLLRGAADFFRQCFARKPERLPAVGDALPDIMVDRSRFTCGITDWCVHNGSPLP